MLFYIATGTFCTVTKRSLVFDFLISIDKHFLITDGHNNFHTSAIIIPSWSQCNSVSKIDWHFKVLLFLQAGIFFSIDIITLALEPTH
jgi:hypothetical protein